MRKRYLLVPVIVIFLLIGQSSYGGDAYFNPNLDLSKYVERLHINMKARDELANSFSPILEKLYKGSPGQALYASTISSFLNHLHVLYSYELSCMLIAVSQHEKSPSTPHVLSMIIQRFNNDIKQYDRTLDYLRESYGNLESKPAMDLTYKLKENVISSQEAVHKSIEVMESYLKQIS
jgi:hypothetical protein